MKTLNYFYLIFILAIFQSANSQSTSETCLECHSDNTLSLERNGKEVSLFVDKKILNNSPHKKLGCISCHTGFDAENIPHKDDIAELNCLKCHNGVEKKHLFHPQLAKAIRNKTKPDVTCKDCHGTHNIVSPKIENSKFNSSNLVKSCGECHKKIAEKFIESSHGKAFEKKVKGAPNCILCHQNKIAKVSVDRDSLSLKVAQEKLCLSCHLNNPNVRAKTSPSTKFISSYDKSVHGIALQHGNTKVASCIDCHGSHEMKKGSEQTSPVNKKNIPNTCGKCHTEISKLYSQSIHGVALANGESDSPSCTQCHGEHNILSKDDPRSPTAPLNISGQVCSPCHSSLKLTGKYGIDNDRFKTFSDSYHGLASRGGEVEVANCASCHGVHNIKSSSDSTSMVHKSNLVKTCGKCHYGAKNNFSFGSVHSSETKKETEPIFYWVTKIYIWVIFIVIGGMLLHNILIFVFEIKKKRKNSAQKISIPRFTKNEVVQHFILFTSFIILAITGFALKYPGSWWANGLKFFGMTEIARQNIHRVSAVAMVALGFYHIGYLFFTNRGKDILKNITPKFSDLKDAVNNILYYLKINKTKPDFGKYDYTEKAEYWALIWGTVVMAITGFILWFPTIFGDWAPIWLVKVGEIIHFYEAILATLAIIVWHWFFVIFHPSEYPMSLTWIDGKMSIENYRHHHDKHFKQIALEFLKFTNGKIKREELSNSAILFEDFISKNGSKFIDIIKNEMKNDLDFKNWISERLN